jgi:hypothetical protein
MSNTADVTGGKSIAMTSQSISGVSAINPLVAFYDIHGSKREVLFFYLHLYVLFFSHIGYFIFLHILIYISRLLDTNCLCCAISRNIFPSLSTAK